MKGEAADVLRISAFLPPEGIPLELITNGAPELGPVLSTALAHTADDPLILDEVLEPLACYSLIRRNLAARTYNIHRLVQEVIKDGMNEATQRLWAERVVRALNCVFPGVTFPQWPLCERLLPHAQLCADLIAGYCFEFPEAVRLLNQVGLYLDARAQYPQAEPLYQRALAIWEKSLGPEHPNVATCLENYADLPRKMKRDAEEEELEARAQGIRERKT